MHFNAPSVKIDRFLLTMPHLFFASGPPLGFKKPRTKEVSDVMTEIAQSFILQNAKDRSDQSLLPTLLTRFSSVILFSRANKMTISLVLSKVAWLILLEQSSKSAILHAPRSLHVWCILVDLVLYLPCIV